MTDVPQPAAPADETLAALLFDVAFPGERQTDPYWFQSHEHDWHVMALLVLASDWLAARDATIRAQVAEHIAEAVEAERLAVKTEALGTYQRRWLGNGLGRAIRIAREAGREGDGRG